ncbi:MAG TPA: hypothetical protein VMC03_03475 [Streptosporangiaceae bacterium]|nr:hypothetical protein [Streptosporangiaceae bacterium]
MPASVSRPASVPRQWGRLCWLPPGGQGNGIDDVAWAPILEVPPDIVIPLLAALGAARVPAYAAGPTVAITGRGRPATAPRCRLWVGTSAYGRAEETLITVLPSLTGRAARGRG